MSVAKLLNEIESQVKSLDMQPKVSDVGTVVSVGDNVAKVVGLSGVQSSEMLKFESGATAIALNLEEDMIDADVSYPELAAGGRIRNSCPDGRGSEQRI
jgi:F-type H+-transporting ATPase subunit alpha